MYVSTNQNIQPALSYTIKHLKILVYMLGAICEFAQFINWAEQFVNW